MAAKLAVVETIFPENARQIPAMLRQAADNIEIETEDDARTVAMVVVQLHEGGDLQVYGWGAIDDHSALGMLVRGQAKIMRFMGDDE